MLDYEYYIDEATQQIARPALQNRGGAGRLAQEMGLVLADHSILLNTLIATVPTETASDFVRAISVTIVGDQTLQVIIVQTGVEPSLEPTLPIGGHPTDTNTLAPSATLTQQPTGTPTPTLPVTLSPTAEGATSTPTRTLVPTATLRITSPTPTVGPVIIQPTAIGAEPTVAPEPTDRPHPNPTRRPPNRCDRTGRPDDFQDCA